MVKSDALSAALKPGGTEKLDGIFHRRLHISNIPLACVTEGGIVKPSGKLSRFEQAWNIKVAFLMLGGRVKPFKVVIGVPKKRWVALVTEEGSRKEAGTAAKLSHPIKMHEAFVRFLQCNKEKLTMVLSLLQA